MAHQSLSGLHDDHRTGRAPKSDKEELRTRLLAQLDQPAPARHARWDGRLLARERGVFDEKPRIQALEWARDWLKLPTGRAFTDLAHEYKCATRITVAATNDSPTYTVKLSAIS